MPPGFFRKNRQVRANAFVWTARRSRAPLRPLQSLDLQRVMTMLVSFFLKKNYFVYLFFQVYRKQEKCEEGKEWKESKGRGFCKNALRQKISYFSILQARLSANVTMAMRSSAHRLLQTMLVCFFCTKSFFVFLFIQKRILESKYFVLQSKSFKS